MCNFKTQNVMTTEDLENDVGTVDFSHYMFYVIADLKSDGKYPAAHTYTSTLHSFLDFSGGTAVAMHEVFTPGRLKEYENWLMVLRRLSLNTVSTYMRTLQAVYNRWTPPGTAGHNPKLFSDVYTKVESHTKRALTEQQMNRLMATDTSVLSPAQKRVFAYFILMFLLRGMPLIDLAHLRKKDVQGNTIVYRRHKTGKQMTVHIPKEAQWLIHEFRDQNPRSVYLFPILDGRLRDGWQLYRCYQDALRCFNKSLQKLMGLLLPGAKVSSYTARHTWATLAYHLGTSVGLISQSLGHSSIRVTETYLKPFNNEMVDKANRRLISYVRKCKGGNFVMHNVL